MDIHIPSLSGVANTVLEAAIAAGETISNAVDACNRWRQAPTPATEYKSDSDDGYEFEADSADEELVTVQAYGAGDDPYGAREDILYGALRYRPPGQMERFFHTGRLFVEGITGARTVQQEQGVVAGVHAVWETLRRSARDSDFLEQLQMGRQIAVRSWENVEEFLEFVARRLGERQQPELRADSQFNSGEVSARVIAFGAGRQRILGESPQHQGELEGTQTARGMTEVLNEVEDLERSEQEADGEFRTIALD